MDARQRLNELRGRYNDLSVLIFQTDEDLAQPGLSDLRRLTLKEQRTKYERERQEVLDEYDELRAGLIERGEPIMTPSSSDGRIEKLSDQMDDVRIRLRLLENKVDGLTTELSRLRKVVETPESGWPHRWVWMFSLALVAIMVMLVAISVQVL